MGRRLSWHEHTVGWQLAQGCLQWTGYESNLQPLGYEFDTYTLSLDHCTQVGKSIYLLQLGNGLSFVWGLTVCVLGLSLPNPRLVSSYPWRFQVGYSWRKKIEAKMDTNQITMSTFALWLMHNSIQHCILSVMTSVMSTISINDFFQHFQWRCVSIS